MSIYMPSQAHPDDIKWITEVMDTLTPQLRAKAMQGYDSVYKEAMQVDLPPHRLTNHARRSANTRLRIFAGKFAKASMGYCSAPPSAS